MTTLEDYLRLHARERANHLAIIDGERRLTYAELYARSAEQATAYAPGEPVLLPNTQDADFLIRYFAIHLARAIAVPADADLPEQRLHDIRQKLASAQNIPADTADILFTTGTTGQSKGVMLSCRALIADAENLIAGQGYHDRLTFIISGPLCHIGSLSKVWPMIRQGGTLLITRGMKDMNAFFAAIHDADGPVATFLVPASIRMLLRFSAKQLAKNASRIEFIETGAAPIAQTDMEQLHQLLPETRLYNTYASTETGIVSTYDYAHEPLIAGCLGRPLPHARVFINKVGLVIVSGDMVMSGYVGDEALTATTLISDAVHTTDRGFIDSRGCLNLQGRADDIINVGGYKINPTEVEDAALSCPGVADCICIPAQHPVLGTVAKLLVVTVGNVKLDTRSLARTLAEKLERYKVPTLYAQVDHIARTFNGKPDRKHYVQIPFTSKWGSLNYSSPADGRNRRYPGKLYIIFK